MNKSWIFVALTSIFELFWIYGFNVASHWSHWILIVAMILADFWFLYKASEGLPTGTVYAIFAAAGTIGTAMMDIFIFGAQFTTLKGVFVSIILFGVIILNLADYIEEKKAKGEI